MKKVVEKQVLEQDYQQGSGIGQGNLQQISHEDWSVGVGLRKCHVDEIEGWGSLELMMTKSCLWSL